MPVDLSLLVLLILFTGGVLQGSVGFESGVFFIPLLLVIGLTLPEAVGIQMVCTIVQNGLGVYQLRHHIRLCETIFPVVLRYAFLGVGFWALCRVGTLDPNQVKQIAGVVLLGVLAAQFGVSGVVTGLCAMGGPFMALWVMTHDWSPQRSRGFLFFIFLVTLTPQAIIMLIIFRGVVANAYLFGLLALPVSVAGA